MKRFFAIFGIIFLLALYLIAFVCAFIKTEFAQTMMMAAIVGTICIPVILYAYLVILQNIQKNKEPQDPGQ